ncbi:MAG: DUF4307 domain-containing protein [Nocardioides sp.]|nr:DUF4307 domain-containing protein [Nocardioides sp.]
MSSDEARIAERYGTGRRRRPGVLLSVLIAVLVVIIAWFGWVLWIALNPKVSSGLETWVATSENSVSVTYVVRIHAKGAVPTCSVEAQDANEGVVGHLTFKAKPGRNTVTFPTDRKALRVNWNSCTAPGQKDPQ